MLDLLDFSLSPPVLALEGQGEETFQVAKQPGIGNGSSRSKYHVSCAWASLVALDPHHGISPVPTPVIKQATSPEREEQQD